MPGVRPSMGPASEKLNINRHNRQLFDLLVGCPAARARRQMLIWPFRARERCRAENSRPEHEGRVCVWRIDHFGHFAGLTRPTCRPNLHIVSPDTGHWADRQVMPASGSAPLKLPRRRPDKARLETSCLLIFGERGRPQHARGADTSRGWQSELPK